MIFSLIANINYFNSSQLFFFTYEITINFQENSSYPVGKFHSKNSFVCFVHQSDSNQCRRYLLSFPRISSSFPSYIDSVVYWCSQGIWSMTNRRKANCRANSSNSESACTRNHREYWEGGVREQLGSSCSQTFSYLCGAFQLLIKVFLRPLPRSFLRPLPNNLTKRWKQPMRGQMSSQFRHNKRELFIYYAIYFDITRHILGIFSTTPTISTKSTKLWVA